MTLAQLMALVELDLAPEEASTGKAASAADWMALGAMRRS